VSLNHPKYSSRRITLNTKIKLTIGERFGLFQLLPQEGDIITYKELRKLKETLNPTSKEDEEYGFKYGFRCPHTEMQPDGKRFQCEFEEFAETAPLCPIHNQSCVMGNRLIWKPEMAMAEKEIFFSKLAMKIITEALKKASEEKKVNDSNYSLFVKFGIEDKDD
jgi:hypothetical protein